MSYSQNLMKPGNWSLKLKADTPREILDQLSIQNSTSTYAGFGTILATPTWIDPVAVGTQGLLDKAYYAGRYIERRNGYELAGDGIEGWLGTGNGVGYLANYNRTGASFTTWFDDARTLLAEQIPTGTFTDPGGTFTWNSGKRVVNRDLLTQLNRAFGTEWRMNPNLTIDGGTETVIYGSSVRAVFHPNARASEPGQTILSGEAEFTESVRDYIYEAFLYDGAGTSGVAYRSSPPTWSSPWDRGVGSNAQIYRRQDVSGTSTSGMLDAQAATILLYEPIIQSTAKLTLTNYDPTLRLCGYKVDLWDPEKGIQDTTATQQFVAGELVTPLRLRCMTLSAPFVGGIYFVSSYANTDFTSLTALDLTNYVDFAREPRTASAECGVPEPTWAVTLRRHYEDWLA